ncbi:LysR family transcriptional regulator [Colwellia psychrerythraea]|uniref:Transcriptional regulator, LysR family n=1 Tax=Colwellia psychrerythraea (strain 34H / ATCC BAA-681) TaxID=167879 RepID=Q47ZI6_COLP3|nr:LysR family transcriptional regulator [Colwellia psychrerythraea]AAZ28069.1 transcriptional regulator, LysR family [Colwellia psychrerythraea 34H]
MIDELRAMAIFAETIKQGSFRAAAKELKLSPSVVSYQVTQLEKSVGTALIYRSTRKLSLTSEGGVLYQYALNMIQAAQQGLNQVAIEKQELRGTLTLTLPSALIKSEISKKISQFSKLHPFLNFKLFYTDDRQDLIHQGIDLAFRAGSMDDSNLKSKRVGEINRKLVCSYDYWKENIPPISPQDLTTWNWIKLDMLPNHRTLVNSAGEKCDIDFESNISVNNVEAMTQLCINGAGIATPPDYLIEKEIENNALVELLPNWQVESIPLYAVWPSNVFQNSSVKRLLEFLI